VLVAAPVEHKGAKDAGVARQQVKVHRLAKLVMYKKEAGGEVNPVGWEVLRSERLERHASGVSAVEV